jgi:hypothetical protein
MAQKQQRGLRMQTPYLFGSILTASAMEPCQRNLKLDSLNVLGLPTLRSLHHIELDRLAFLKRAETARLNGRKVNEDVFAIGAADESETLGIIKPLDCTLFHNISSEA